MALLQSIEDKTFAAHIKQIASALTSQNTKEEKLAETIYAQLVVAEFNKSDALSYKQMKEKAKDAAKAYYKTEE